jgi:uncharacterized protein (TIGR03083 family)
MLAAVERGQLYAEARGRITDIVSGLNDDQLKTPVPCAPEWTVHDLLRHLVGVAADVCSGRTEGGGSPPWTAAQVEARRDKSVKELLDEWAEVSPQLEKLLDEVPPVQRTLADITCHEHDLRGALGQPGARDTDNVDFALQMGVAGLGSRITEAGLPALRLKSGNQEWEVGKGEPTATVTADAFDLQRSLFGRRSLDQIRALQWDGDPEPYLPVFAVFTPPTEAPAGG